MIPIGIIVANWEINSMKRLLASVCFCFLAAGFAGCGRQDSAAAAFQMPPPLVTLAPAVKRDVPLYLDEIGTCTARQFVSITPQVTGPIMEIHFQDGAEIHKGDPLFAIDPRPYQAALDQALASKQQSQAALDFAALEEKRYAGLLPGKAVSQDDYDTKKNALEVAQAQVASSNAAVETARLNLQYCSISSPVDGRAGQRLVDIGNVVMANQGSLLVVQTLDPIYADFTCAEGELPGVRSYAKNGNLKVLVKLPTDTGDGQEGELTFIDTQVQNQAGTVHLRATLPNADHHLWPGQFVNVRLILNVENDAVLVPVAAEQVGQTGPFVYVVDSKMIAQVRPVKLGQKQGDMVVVEDGVKPGEQVITDGQMLVIPGGPVRLPMPAAAAGGNVDAGAKS
jgi:multidrug efflux system membrane fusion protein